MIRRILGPALVGALILAAPGAVRAQEAEDPVFYTYEDDEGVPSLVQGLDAVPERYRSRARPITAEPERRPPPRAAPPEERPPPPRRERREPPRGFTPADEAEMRRFLEDWQGAAQAGELPLSLLLGATAIAWLLTTVLTKLSSYLARVPVSLAGCAFVSFLSSVVSVGAELLWPQQWIGPLATLVVYYLGLWKVAAVDTFGEVFRLWLVSLVLTFTSGICCVLGVFLAAGALLGAL